MCTALHLQIFLIFYIALVWHSGDTDIIFFFRLSCFFFPLAQCLIYVQLPYMEDLRQYVFSSLKNSKKYTPTGKTFAGQLENNLLVVF